MLGSICFKDIKIAMSLFALAKLNGKFFNFALIIVYLKHVLCGGGRVFLLYAAWLQESGAKAAVACCHAASSPKRR
jgi:hypothetical protein